MSEIPDDDELTDQLLLLYQKGTDGLIDTMW